MSPLDTIAVEEVTPSTGKSDSGERPTAWPDFDYGTAGKDYAQKRWPDEKVINLILGGRYVVPRSRSAVLRLVEQRFGCIFHLLSKRFQNDPEIRRIAEEQSAGHELRRSHSGQGETFFPWAKATRLSGGEITDCA